MVLAMAIVGFLIGITLTITVGVFGVLSMDGGFAENLRAAGLELRRRITGQHRQPPAAAVRSAEVDNRVRGLQEEVKVMQRLLEQGRVERETLLAAARQSAEDMEALRAGITTRDERIAAMDEAGRSSSDETLRLREQLGSRDAELATARRDLRDLETELSLAQSGSDFTSISGEMARLSRERDELAARLERLTRLVRQSQVARGERSLAG